MVDTDGASYSPHVISNATAGNYTVRAVVQDNDGATAETTVQFSVGSDNPPPPPPPPGDDGNNPPTVSITSPANGQNFNPGSTVTVALDASDSDGSVVFHQIFVNGALVDTDGANFTPHYIQNAAAGNYTVRALVRDNDGATAETTIQFSVGSDNPPPPPPPPGDDGNNPPTVSITSPANGQNFNPGSIVAVALDASDSDGSVVFHQIFVNGILVDTDGANFTPHYIQNAAAGNYTVRALVRDNDGATAETTIQFSVGSDNPPPPPPPAMTETTLQR